MKQDSGIEFHKTDQWYNSLNDALMKKPGLVIKQDLSTLSTSEREVDDVSRQKLRQLNTNKLYDAFKEWVSNKAIITYHATRLPDEDINAIRCSGLRSLAALGYAEENDSKEYYHRNNHIYTELNLNSTIESSSPYLQFGSDNRYSKNLNSPQELDDLEKTGKPVVFLVRTDGLEAIEIAHTFPGATTADDYLQKNDLPNLAKQFLLAWMQRRIAGTQYRSPQNCELHFKNQKSVIGHLEMEEDLLNPYFCNQNKIYKIKEAILTTT